MPEGTPFHPRTFALSRSLGFKDWAGYHAATSYEVHHEHEYNAIRQACGLIDVSPLYKYEVSGPDALKLANRVVSRDSSRIEVGQVHYVCWTDARGHVLDDGTLQRLSEKALRWTSAEPALRWLQANSARLDVRIEDETDRVAALALQGPTSRDVLQACVSGPVVELKFFRVMPATLAGVPVQISRTGYTGDLGYEVFLPAEQALQVWDAVIQAGQAYGLRPSGLLALDVARIEAGFVLQGVDYVGARRAELDSQRYTPYEIGLSRLVQLGKSQPFVGREALKLAEKSSSRRLVGLELVWDDLERAYDQAGLAPHLPATASRVQVPVFRDGVQVGRATSSTWSPILKKMIALASVPAEASAPGTRLEIEHTVECRRRTVGALVVRLPFFDPPRKRS